MQRRQFLRSIVGLTTASSIVATTSGVSSETPIQPAIASIDWTINAIGSVTVITVYGRLTKPVPEDTQATVLLRLSPGDMRCVTEHVESGSDSYAITVVTTSPAVYEDTIDIRRVTLGSDE